LGLSPVDDLNGPSYVKALYQTGRMKDFIVSFQFTDWSSDDNKYTVGGDVEDAFGGSLLQNYILADTPWLFNINY
jgi:hypothetical protein